MRSTFLINMVLTNFLTANFSVVSVDTFTTKTEKFKVRCKY